jgi:uncharacterized phiE125 gp8 family phage protein
MTLYTLADLKAYLRIEHNAEDTLLTGLALSAVSMIESYLHRPIRSAQRTFVDMAQPVGGGRVGALLVPVYPLGTLLSVLHDDGESLDVDTLGIAPVSGRIRKLDGTPFRAGPWTITATVGLEHADEYDTRILPVIRHAVRDVVADLYQRRNPAASAEAEGGGVSVAYGTPDAQGIPLRTAALLRPWRLVEVGA